MADIFLSYTEQDREQARRVAAMLESVGWSVWWDRRIPAGETWRSVLEEALQDMRCMIVLWSAHSIESEWVNEEATEGRRLERLLPVLIEPVRPPAGFREIQAADLTNWDGSREFEGMRMLVADLERLLGKPVPGATDIPTTASDHGHAYDPADRAGGPTARDRWPRRGLSAIVAAGALLLAAGAAFFTLSAREPTAVIPRASETGPQQPAKPSPAEPAPPPAMHPPPAPAAVTVAPREPDPAPSAPPANTPAVANPNLAARPVAPRRAETTRATSARCADLVARMQLGESLSHEAQDTFRKECQQ